MKKFSLDTGLFKLSENVVWTARHAVEGVQIFGGIGSGKTSGSGRLIAMSYLKAGFGGLVLTVKPDEKEMWTEYCRIAGRQDDLIVIEPGGDHFFNFLEYESRSGITDNIMQVLKTVIRARADKSGGGGDTQFWDDSLDMLICTVIDLCKLAYGKAEIQLIYDIVQSLPAPNKTKDSEEKSAYDQAYEAARANVLRQKEEWKSNLSVAALYEVSKSDSALDDALCRDVPDARTFRIVKQFFTETYMPLSEKTRSIIDFSFSGFLFRLLRDPVYSLFCDRESTVEPEASIDGKIILINLPVKQYHKVGQDAQIMFKYIWQRAMEKRVVRHDTMPVFLWADEAQNVIHEHDADCQATARSSRVATVYISQNLPNYYANMGSTKFEFKVKSFLGTLGTKFFHANGDVETNRYASELIGDIPFIETGKNTSFGKHIQMGNNKSMRFDKAVRPEKFSTLRTGGTLNEDKAECFVHLQAHTPNFFKLSFDQNASL